jgi:hypothetical protein
MPKPYVKKLAKKHRMSVKESEDKWKKAEKLADKQGHVDNYAYRTSIYKSLMGEKGSMDAVDTVQMDVPFLIRIMELARETLKSDVELHVAVEKIITLSKEGILDMQAYEQMFGVGEESAALKEIALRIQAARKRIPAILRAR